MPKKSELFAHLGRKIILQHPFAYLKLASRSAALMMLSGGPDSLAEITGISPHVALRLLLIYTLPVFCFSILGLLQLWKENRVFFYLSFLTIFYFVVVSSGAETNSRFRVPIEPIYAILVAIGIESARKHLRGRLQPENHWYSATV